MQMVYIDIYFLPLAQRPIIPYTLSTPPPTPPPPIKTNTWGIRANKFLIQYQCHPVTFSTRFPFSTHFTHCKHKIEAKTWPFHTIGPLMRAPITLPIIFLPCHPPKASIFIKLSKSIILATSLGLKMKKVVKWLPQYTPENMQIQNQVNFIFLLLSILEHNMCEEWNMWVNW